MIETRRQIIDPVFLSPGQEHYLGIYGGGVGPFAHTIFERAILEQGKIRGATGDQANPIYTLESAASTPDRTASYKGEGPDSLPALKYFTQKLEAQGAEAVFVICNTAHIYHKQVQETLRVPWVHLLRITADHIRKQFPEDSAIGVMATDGTLQAGIYDEALRAYNLRQVAPERKSPQQKMTMNGIYHPDYGVKYTGSTVSDQAIENFVTVANWLVDEKKASAIIAGCTEIPAGLNEATFKRVPIIDPMVVGANLFLDISYGNRHSEEFLIAS